MGQPYFVVDAFADALFCGNPAGVLPLAGPMDEALMQKIAFENNLAETAFAYREGDSYRLRWFTPCAEIDLCGHATLGTAYVLANFVEPGSQTFRFMTRSGLLTVTRRGDLYEMDFPSRMPQAVPVTPEMGRALGRAPKAAWLSRDLLLEYDTEASIRALAPDFAAVAALPDGMAVIVTAPGNGCDFVSRFFAPKVGISEDPVTGSSHSTLTPFWAQRLGKAKLTARQLSKRGGALYCEDAGERVKIAGKAVLYLKGELSV